MKVRFANGYEIKTSSNYTGWSWRQDYTRAWYMIAADHPLVLAARRHFEQRVRNAECAEVDEQDMVRCLC